jgi:hypothetical protein
VLALLLKLLARAAVRVATDTTRSRPIAAQTRYDRWTGDFDLVQPVEREADIALRILCRRYARRDDAERRWMRSAMSSNDLSTLMTFADQSAVFAMRDRQLAHVVDGLTALAMIDPGRIDPRDTPTGLTLLHAARMLGTEPAPLFRAAANLADEHLAQSLAATPSRSEAWIQRWGYAVVETEAGPGLVKRSYKKYEPSVPLDRIAIALARVFEADRYGPTSVTVATDIPKNWLVGVDAAALSGALRSVRASVSIQADAKEGIASGDRPSHMLLAFVAELADEDAAESLLRIARARTKRYDGIAILGLREARLFCLLVARPAVNGIPRIESSGSVRRFAPAISGALRSYPIG